MKPALFSVLCEVKKNTALGFRNVHDQCDPPDQNLMRLDNMLIAEGINNASGTTQATASGSNQDTTIENSEYKTKLNQIRKTYNEEWVYHMISRLKLCFYKISISWVFDIITNWFLVFQINQIRAGIKWVYDTRHEPFTRAISL